jgi:FkbM family methyltransferase
MNLLLIKARSIARKTGVVGLINRLRRAAPYEQRVREALVNAIKPGDVVWDVGANVGIYSQLFSEWVGESGFVVAFEPSAESYKNIRQRVPDCAWLQVENVALGDADAKGLLVLEGDSVESHIATGTEAKGGANSTVVEICRGDMICKRLGRVPNVIKVDVEGFEEEVLQGMGQILTSPDLRSVLVEVHFMKLEFRGKATAPIRIEKLLRSKGFKTNWVDASHLFATR